MKKKIAKKVPKLMRDAQEFAEEIGKPEYLDGDQPIDVMVEANGKFQYAIHYHQLKT